MLVRRLLPVLLLASCGESKPPLTAGRIQAGIKPAGRGLFAAMMARDAEKLPPLLSGPLAEAYAENPVEADFLKDFVGGRAPRKITLRGFDCIYGSRLKGRVVPGAHDPGLGIVIARFEGWNDARDHMTYVFHMVPADDQGATWKTFRIEVIEKLNPDADQFNF